MPKITFGGDFCLANDPITKKIGIVNRLHATLKQKITKEFSRLFSTSNLTVINFESPIANDIENANDSAFLMPPDVLQILDDCKVQVVNLANNHILQHGEEVFEFTAESLVTRNFKIIGKYDDEISSSILKFSIDNLSIAIAGFNERHDFSNNNNYCTLEKRNVIRTLDKMLQDKVDLRILVFHWGNEYVNFPSRQQIEDAHFYIRYGANVIVGHHPHVIQPVERYMDGIIAYSLGNLLFDNLFSCKVRMGILLDLFWENNRQDFKIRPLWLDEKEVNDTRKSDIVLREYESICKRYEKLKDLDAQEYDKLYAKELKKGRLKQRILMKLHITKLLIQSHQKERMQLMKNLFELFFNKVRNEIN